MKSMAHHENLSATDAMSKLKSGNERYLDAATNPGDVRSEERRVGKEC